MQRPKILLVEDESIMRMDVKEMLLDAGYDVVGDVADGEKAVEAAYRVKPDLIIMDVKMPKMNGIKASKIISQSLSIPILLLTAYSQRDLIEEAKSAYITGYLIKPIRESDLIPAIEIALTQAKRVSNLQEDVRSLEKRLEARKTIERAKGVIMEQHQLSEEEAYQVIRKESMAKRVTMEQTAKHILSSGRKLSIKS